MSWRPLDIFKLNDETFKFCDTQFTDHNIALNENTVRSLLVNSAIAERFTKKIVDSDWLIEYGKKIEK